MISKEIQYYLSVMYKYNTLFDQPILQNSLEDIKFFYILKIKLIEKGSQEVREYKKEKNICIKKMSDVKPENYFHFIYLIEDNKTKIYNYEERPELDYAQHEVEELEYEDEYDYIDLEYFDEYEDEEED